MIWYWLIAFALVLVSTLLHIAGVVRFDTSIHWTGWLVVALVLLNGGWMAFDGGRALVVGDYVTPKKGELPGTLGTWSKVVAAVGIPPRSTLMKCVFVAYGLAYLGVTGAMVLGASRAWWGVLLMAVLGLWYVPFGTLINIVVIVLLSLPSLRASLS